MFFSHKDKDTTLVSVNSPEVTERLSWNVDLPFNLKGLGIDQDRFENMCDLGALGHLTVSNGQDTELYRLHRSYLPKISQYARIPNEIWWDAEFEIPMHRLLHRLEQSENSGNLGDVTMLTGILDQTVRNEIRRLGSETCFDIYSSPFLLAMQTGLTGIGYAFLDTIQNRVPILSEYSHDSMLAALSIAGVSWLGNKIVEASYQSPIGGENLSYRQSLLLGVEIGRYCGLQLESRRPGLIGVIE